jgi:hypothetical protein
MKPPVEDTLVEVWRQTLVEGASTVLLGKKKFPVRRTPRLGLREVEFDAGRRRLVGLEQNPRTSSRWGLLARAGKKVMQFIENGNYVAAVMDGKAVLYKRST